jgi:hypothetical protein
MKYKTIYLFAIILSNCYLATAQAKRDTDEQILMNFLQTVSAPNYKSSLGDFRKFFKSESIEIEGGFRHEYAIQNPGNELSWDLNTRSLAIDHFLADTAVKRLIRLKNENNCNWTILSSYKVGTSSSIYVIGIKQAGGSFQIQMTNFPESTPSGICEILGATGKSMFSSIYQK